MNFLKLTIIILTSFFIIGCGNSESNEKLKELEQQLDQINQNIKSEETQYNEYQTQIANLENELKIGTEKIEFLEKKYTLLLSSENNTNTIKYSDVKDVLEDFKIDANINLESREKVPVTDKDKREMLKYLLKDYDTNIEIKSEE